MLLPVILGMAAFAVDMGNLYVAQNHLQAAVDAGALAGALELPYDPNLTRGQATAAAMDMVHKNYASANVDSVYRGNEVRSICVHATDQVNLTLMGVLGITSESVQAKACAGFNNLEVVFVIDNTGSMSGSPISRVREASQDLVDLILPDGAAPSTKVGLVPFRGKIHLPANVDGKPDGCRNADGSVNTGLLEQYWSLSGTGGSSKGGGDDPSTSDPSTGSGGSGSKHKAGNSTSGASKSGVSSASGSGSKSSSGGVWSDPYAGSRPPAGKGGGDDPSTSDPGEGSGSDWGWKPPTTPTEPTNPVPQDTCSNIPRICGLTTDKTKITNAIQSQTATGNASGTVISEGITWGTKVLTPEWPYEEGGDFEDYRKVMILLTDGDTEDGTCGPPYQQPGPNVYWTNAYYGMGEENCHCEDSGCLNHAMLDAAEYAKNLGIEIFTIRFGTSDYTDKELMKTMASSKPGTEDHYFDAPTAEDIPEVFKEIGRQLGWRLLN